MSITKKHWKEFKIFVKQYKEQTEEDQKMEDLGLPSRRRRAEEEEDEEYQLVRISFPLEDVVDYFESYNSIKKVKGVCLTLAHGISYFVCTPYDEFKGMRIEAGLEHDPAPKITQPTEETF